MLTTKNIFMNKESEQLSKPVDEKNMNREENEWHSYLSSESSHLDLPKCAKNHLLITGTFKMFFKLYNRLSVSGTENIPAKGPFIVAPNHQSFLDGPLVVTGMDDKTLCNCYFYATEEHVKGKARRRFARRHNIILMQRSDLKTSILRLAEVLKEGKNVVIFPEGRRSDSGKLSKFRRTFAILSKELGVPVLPICIRGAYEALPRTCSFVKPKKIEIEYLPIVKPDDYSDYDEMAEAVRSKIQERL